MDANPPISLSPRWWLLVGICLVLAACSTKGPSRPGSSASKTPARTGGGYYLDDGPLDAIPANLDQIPDAVPVDAPLHRFANRPYVALGQNFVPDTSNQPYTARGIASWYGRKFHGQRTSSGEEYNMFGMTAAHPTLPIPSYARVTSVANGRSVVVRVNDRGPFLRGRVIDLSYVAAYKLGYIGQGSAEVIVERVFPGDHSTPPLILATTPLPKAPPLVAVALSEQNDVYLQVGAFGTQANAEALCRTLQPQLFTQNIAAELDVVNRDGLYKVRLGPFDTVEQARTVAQQLNVQTVVMR